MKIIPLHSPLFKRLGLKKLNAVYLIQATLFYQFSSKRCDAKKPATCDTALTNGAVHAAPGSLYDDNGIIDFGLLERIH